jgi:hypothetical protein
MTRVADRLERENARPWCGAGIGRQESEAAWGACQLTSRSTLIPRSTGIYGVTVDRVLLTLVSRRPVVVIRSEPLAWGVPQR